MANATFLNKLTKKLFGESYSSRSSLIQLAINEFIVDNSRHYHTWDKHIDKMLRRLLEVLDEQNNLATLENIEMWFWAILFHDIVYDFKKVDGYNERQSARKWLEDVKLHYPQYPMKNVNQVSEMILATYGHESTDPVVREFLKMDLWGFTGTFQDILNNELLVRQEYAWVDWIDYKENRIKFLEAYSNNSVIKELGVSEQLLKEVEHMKHMKQPNIGVYLGTFNPFHIGHLDILLKAERIFDKVIIVFADNPDKPYTEKKVPLALNNRQVEFVSGSIVKFIEGLKYDVTIVRGLRNSTDLQYEQNYLTWLNDLAKEPLRFVSIFSEKTLEHVSSRDIKHLMKIDGEVAKKYILD